MQYFSKLVATVSLIAAVSVSAEPIPVDSSLEKRADWKYAVGWDGVTLPASAIGEAGAVNTSHTLDARLDKRALGGVYICEDIHWGGTCGYAVQAINTCITLGSDWNKKISSFGPDECTGCQASVYANCGWDTSTTSPTAAKTSWVFNYPGDDTGGLSTPDPWNDKISSFWCYQTC